MIRYVFSILIFLILVIPLGAIVFSPEDIARIEKAAIGETIGITEPAGDGCNTCILYYQKVSDSEVRHTGMGGMCTLLACIRFSPPINFREEPKP